MSEPRSVVVAIHQPNFFPWLGYFDKLARADVFIALDDVQFEKSGSGTWSNRVRLMVAGQPAWVTMPIRRDYHGVRDVKDMQIDNGQRWREKLLKTIRASYARSRHCAETFDMIEPWVRNPTDSLAEYNVAAITSMRAALGLPARFFTRSSSLGVTSSATDRLIDLVKAVGGTTYLAGGGAAGYQEDERFAAAGLQLRYQHYAHPVYAQRPNADFVPGLSCLDAMFHCGAAGAGEMLIAQAQAAAALEAPRR